MSGNNIDSQRIENAVREILLAVGDDPQREGLQKTPERVAKMYAELLSGIASNPREHLICQFTEDHHGEMVIVRDISFSSLCEHHMLPFIGKAHVAYIPAEGRITGLSKIARVIEGYSQRLQLQERLTSQIADAFVEVLRPQGVLVVLEAEHMCMSIRGIKKPGTLTVTSAVRGVFRNNATRTEALKLIKGY